MITPSARPRPLKDSNAAFDIEKLLTNRRGKMTSSNILKLLLVFVIGIFLQCGTLIFSKDFIIYNHISSTRFLFIAFTLTAILSIIQQKTWRYLTYLNRKGIPIIVFQGILYSFSFLCLVHGITSSGMLQYYGVSNVIQIFNMCSNMDKVCKSASKIKSKTSSLLLARLQLFASVLCFAFAIYVYCTQSALQLIGILSLMMYHIISYLREQHYTAANRQYKSFRRVEPLGFVLAAFIVLSLSIFSHFSVSSLALPHHDHHYDIQEKFANDERQFMHHSANHDIDVSAKITHRLRLLLSADMDDADDAGNAAQRNTKNSNKKPNKHEDGATDGDEKRYQQKMKELEELAEPTVSSNAHSIGFMQYSIWSVLVYALFVLFFILLNPHLSYLQLRLYELVFANNAFNAVVKYDEKAKLSTDANKPVADILKLTTKNSPSGSNHDEKNVILIAPKWSKLLVLYQLISIQYIGMLCVLIISMFKVNARASSAWIVLASIAMFLGNELSVRSMMKLQLSYHPYWFNYVLYFLFGGMVVSTMPSSRLTPMTSTSLSRIHTDYNRANRGSLLFTMMSNIPSFIQHLRDVQTSRRIFIFLSMNFMFMFVEFVYGYFSNSLGLISDACHMLFDCIALVIGLLASYLGSQHATNSSLFSKDDVWLNKNKYSYGYGKIKVLSGFINAIFLVYIGISVLIESFERIIHPPHIHGDQLLIVSVLGLFVNLIGLFFFHDAHMSGHGDHHHGHDHHHHGHGHGHGHDHAHHHHDHNLRGIFLHILADTLGSVGVIISSLLIYFFDLTVFDALCSVFIALLIFMTVYPLIQSTSKILLQETPDYVLSSLRNDLTTVLSSVNGIIGYREPHFWENEPGNLIGSIHIQISENANEQQLLAQISHILQTRFGFKNEKDITIQIEKQSFLDKCDPIHHSVYSNIVPIQKRKSATPLRHHQHHQHHANSHHEHHSHDHDHDHDHCNDHSHDHSHGHEHEHDHDHHHHGSHEHHVHAQHSNTSHSETLSTSFSAI